MEDTDDTALVTGAAGFIGARLSAELLDRGYDVYGVDSYASGSPERVAELAERDRFRFVEGDIRDASLVCRLLDDVDAVFHQAALTSVGRSFDEPVETSDVNCTGTATLLSEAAGRGLDSIVVASSASVYGSGASQPVSEDAPLEPESPYAASKCWTERLAIQLDDRLDASVVALRYFNVYGPGQDPSGAYAAVVPAFVSRVRNGRPPVVHGDGKQTRDFVHVRDVVRANVAAAESDRTGEAYNVGSGERTSINELAALCADAADVDVTPESAPARDGDVRHSWADISKIRADLGFEPTVDLRDGIAELVAGDADAQLTRTDEPSP